MDRQQATRELVIGLVLGVVVIAIAAYWMWSASRGSVPFVLAFGLPNNLIVNLVILAVLAAILGYAFTAVNKARR